MIWSRRNRSPIGVDLGSRQVKALQLCRVRGAWHVSAAAAFPNPCQAGKIEPILVEQLDDVLYRQGFGGRDLVLAVPDDRLRSGMLELPAGSDMMIEKMAAMEVARMHKLEPGSFELACWALPAPDRAAKTVQVMTAACAHRDADQVLDVFEARGFNVCALDIQACALARASAALRPDTDRVVAILDVDWHLARLLIMHGPVITFERHLSEAGLAILEHKLAGQLDGDRQVAAHVMRRVGLRPPQPDQDGAQLPTRADLRRTITVHFEAMLNELLTALSYMSRQYPDLSLGTLVLTGSGASIAGLAEYIETMLGVDVKLVSPADLVACPAGLEDTCADAAMTMALGLALVGSTRLI